MHALTRKQQQKSPLHPTYPAPRCQPHLRQHGLLLGLQLYLSGASYSCMSPTRCWNCCYPQPRWSCLNPACNDAVWPQITQSVSCSLSGVDEDLERDRSWHRYAFLSSEEWKEALPNCNLPVPCCGGSGAANRDKKGSACLFYIADNPPCGQSTLSGFCETVKSAIQMQTHFMSISKFYYISTPPSKNPPWWKRRCFWCWNMFLWCFSDDRGQIFKELSSDFPFPKQLCPFWGHEGAGVYPGHFWAKARYTVDRSPSVAGPLSYTLTFIYRIPLRG